MSSLALVSLLLAPTPWLFPSVAGVALGLVVHLAWFIACEALVGARLVPAPSGVSVSAPKFSSGTPVPAAVIAPAVASPPMARAPAPAARDFIQVPVLAVFDEAPDMKTIRLGRPDDLVFDAGQFVTVRVRVDGKDHVRCYSISSAPEVRGYFEVTVKRQGTVSNALHATARPGAMLSIRRPNGKFVYPSGDDRPIVLLAGGVGVTPLMSMLRHAVHTEPTRPVTLLYSAHSPDAFAFRDELATIARRHPQARIILAATREPDARLNRLRASRFGAQEPACSDSPAEASLAPDLRAGRICEAMLRAVPDLAHSVAFICGPKPMIDDMKALLGAIGVPPAQVRHEVFEAAIAASARSAPSAAPTVAPARAAELPMRCVTSAKTVTIRPGETLLDAAERGGIGVASLCRAGVCGTCRTRVTEGDVDCPSTTLDAGERSAGFVLACVATARSACAVEL